MHVSMYSHPKIKNQVFIPAFSVRSWKKR